MTELLIGSRNPALLNAEFWCREDRLLLTREQIRTLNHILLHTDGTGLAELEAFPRWLSQEETAAMMETDVKGRFLNGRPFTAEARKRLTESRNLDALPSKVHPLYAVVCSKTDVRSFPTDEPCTDGEEAFDLFQETQLPEGERVLILHCAGEWDFVRSRDSVGWVRASALRTLSRCQFLNHRETPEPLPCTLRNLCRVALDQLGTPYQWGKTDCSALVQTVYRRFGIFLPRNTAQMLKITLGRRRIQGNTADVLDGLTPGALLLFPGHVMLYLGRTRGKHYALHNFTRCDYPFGTEHRIFSAAVTALEDIHHRSGVSFLRRITVAVDLFSAGEQLDWQF